MNTRLILIIVLITVAINNFSIAEAEVIFLKFLKLGYNHRNIGFDR